MLVTVLIITAILLSLISIVRPQLFQQQYILLILAFLISGGLLWSKGDSIKELPNLSLILLTVTAIFYTVECLRLQNKS
ncbi:hypothetical protein DSM106972_082740 [Dulcicalothrix desertica PCC 7102]|uniref:Uncharacterized protein n=1 Tax=Dulcicalothrix desertica PCC 7102 TaxID=232991 RepID=A0A433UW15_9CYAN|nr:Ycf66 family protein [Dulcicalothrix desertica]RUS98055.1 hypothetical protein DSM106972_082740 [Dulcicalothrix desertica PCC 7102]TWH54541.1 Ycf66 protein [Dulcicalothrix desertica PCC 7102]